jgi:hypothetical protein
MAPHVVAPGVMGMDERSGHCFIARQPVDDAEVYQALRAIGVADLRCIRYGGADASILARLVAMGEASVCDHVPPAEVDASPRTHLAVAAELADAWQVAAAVREALARGGHGVLKPGDLRGEGDAVVLGFSWAGFRADSLRVAAVPGRPGRWVVWPGEETAASFPLSMTLDDSLRDDGRFSDPRWYTAAEWRAGGEGGSPWPF